MVETARIFNRMALVAIGGLSLLIALVVLLGQGSDRWERLQVSAFSWENYQVGAADRGFRLGFNRWIEDENLGDYLTIDGELRGRAIAQGKDLVYLLDELPVYGQGYQVKLTPPTDTEDFPPMKPFLARFSSRDRALLYVGILEEERGQLILFNFTTQTKTVLTPMDLVVNQYRPSTHGDRIFFTAYPRNSESGKLGQELYSVTTGLNYRPTAAPIPAKKITKILGKDYQNANFDVAQFQDTLVIRRTHLEDPTDSSLWVIEPDRPPRSLGITGERFKVAPDGKKVVVAREQKLAIVPLQAHQGSISYVDGYDRILDFSADGEQKIVLDRSQPGQSTLAWLDHNNQPQIIFSSDQPIIDCLLEPRQEQLLYCQIADSAGETMADEYSLVLVDRNTGQKADLLSLPNYRDVHLSMAPDGLGLLFDQVMTGNAPSNTMPITRTGQGVDTGNIYLLPLVAQTNLEEPQRLGAELLGVGYNAQWLP